MLDYLVLIEKHIVPPPFWLIMCVEELPYSLYVRFLARRGDESSLHQWCSKEKHKGPKRSLGSALHSTAAVPPPWLSIFGTKPIP